jgi:hypothetical protein
MSQEQKVYLVIWNGPSEDDGLSIDSVWDSKPGAEARLAEVIASDPYLFGEWSVEEAKLNIPGLGI